MTRKILLTALLSFVSLSAAVGLAQAQSRQLSLTDILVALRSKKAETTEKNRILIDAVRERGVKFTLTADIEAELTENGASSELIASIKASGSKPGETPVVQIASSNPVPVGPKPDVPFYRNRAAAAIAANDPESALVEFGKALELEPSNASLFAERSQVLVKMDKLADAVADLNKAIELDAKNSVYFERRGTLRERLGDQDNALADYDKAVELDAGNEAAKISAGRIRDIRAKLAEQQRLAEKKRLEDEAAKKAAAQPAPKPVTPPSNLVRNIGPLNDLATRLAMPVYPPNEKRMGIQGRVTVMVTIDAEGKVTDAKASDGPAGLRNAAVDAVMRSKFKPYIIDGQAVTVTGMIAFNFVANQ